MAKKLVIPTSKLTSYDPARDGVTAGLLTKWFECRELARLFLVGTTAHYTSEALSFGNFMHATLETFYESYAQFGFTVATNADVSAALDGILGRWKAENPVATPLEIEDMERIAMLVEVVAQEYFPYWEKKDSAMTWKKAEQEFRLPWVVTGRNGQEWKTVLRGKMDAWYMVGKRPGLFETKTKSRVMEGTLVDILSINRQANIYLQALHRMTGVRPAELTYNIIRRPQLRQKAQESFAAFRARLKEDVRKRADFYFFRLKMQLEKGDLDRFAVELNGMMGDFLMWWYGDIGHYRNGDHCENKYGVCPMIAICSHNDHTNYYTRDTVFRELSDG